MLVDAAIRVARVAGFVAVDCLPAVDDGGEKTSRTNTSARAADVRTPPTNIKLVRDRCVVQQHASARCVRNCHIKGIKRRQTKIIISNPRQLLYPFNIRQNWPTVRHAYDFASFFQLPQRYAEQMRDILSEMRLLLPRLPIELARTPSAVKRRKMALLRLVQAQKGGDVLRHLRHKTIGNIYKLKM